MSNNNDCNTCGKCLSAENSEQNETLYTFLIYSENTPGLLSQITAVFTRRQVNIDSLNVCASSTPGVHKFTITCRCNEEMAKMLTKQMEKKIEVLQANYYTDSDIFIIETSLIKLATPIMLENPEISRIIRHHDAKIVEVNPVFATVEKTGFTHDILSLFDILNKEDAVLQFVRSGRICITRSKVEHLDTYLAKREEERNGI